MLQATGFATPTFRQGLISKHILIVPNDHHAQFDQIRPDTAAEMFQLAQKIRSVLPAAVQCEGANFFLSDGEIAGQEVPHSHLHIAPRFSGDGHRMGFSNTDAEEGTRESLDQIAQNIQAKIAPTYSIKEMSTEDFRPLFLELAPKVFDENELIFRPHQVMSQKEKEQLVTLGKRFENPFRLNLGVFKGSEFVGWSWGYQDSPDSFYMVNSAILPGHRQQGLYTRLLNEVLSRVLHVGFQRIYSRHSQTNNAILIPKLKRGFKLTSFELSDMFGTLVHLTYFTNPTRRKVLEFRTGSLRPDEDLCRLFDL